MYLAVLIGVLLLDTRYAQTLFYYGLKLTKIILKPFHFEEDIQLPVALVLAYLMVGGWFVLPVLIYFEIARLLG